MNSRTNRAVSAASTLLLGATLLLGCGSKEAGEPTTPESASVTTTTTTTDPTTTTTSETTTEETTTEETDTSDTAESSTTVTASRRTPGGTYRGSASITLTSYDYCGPGGQHRAIGTQTYSAQARLDISARLGGEANPFSLTFLAGGSGSPGAISLASSFIATTSGTDVAGNPRDPRLLLTYWRLSYSGERLTGQLVDNHIREGVANNLFNGIKLLVACRPELGTLPGGFPSAIDNGATLSGTLTGGAADLTVQATTTDGLFAFRMRFTA